MKHKIDHSVNIDCEEGLQSNQQMVKDSFTDHNLCFRVDSFVVLIVLLAFRVRLLGLGVPIFRHLLSRGGDVLLDQRFLEE